MPIGRFNMSKGAENAVFVRLSVSDTLCHLLNINISGMSYIEVSDRPINKMTNYPFE